MADQPDFTSIQACAERPLVRGFQARARSSSIIGDARSTPATTRSSRPRRSRTARSTSTPSMRARSAIPTWSSIRLLIACTVVGISVEDLSEARRAVSRHQRAGVSSAGLSGRYADRAQHRGVDARIGQPRQLRHRHLAHRGAQSTRRNGHQLRTHQPGRQDERSAT